MDVSTLFGPLITACTTGIVTGVGVYVAVTNRLTKLETLIDTLRADVERHNTVVERMYRLEADQVRLAHEVDDVRNHLD